MKKITLFIISFISFFILYIFPFLLAFSFGFLDYLFDSRFLTESISRATLPEYANPVYYNLAIQLGTFGWHIFLTVKEKETNENKLSSLTDIGLFFWYFMNVILGAIMIWITYELNHGSTKGSLWDNNF